MDKNQVVKKLNCAIKNRIAQLKRWKYNRAQIAERMSKVSIRNVTSLIYKVRSNYFSNSSGTCGLNPETMEGHSYSWYSLVKKIKGRVVLNDYGYSKQTSKHIRQVSNVLKTLGIKYVCLKAPRGLQNMESSLRQEILNYTEKIVKNKYCRGEKYCLVESKKRLALLKSLGFEAPQSLIKNSLQYWENDRAEKLERQRQKRLDEKPMRDEKRRILKAHIETLKQSKFCYAIYNKYGRNGYKKSFEIFTFDELQTINKSENRRIDILSVQPAIGETKKQALNILKVTQRIKGEL